MPIPENITSLTVSEDRQEQFAALSGDRNPIHMDRVAARRTQAGQRVVHGIHTLLGSLEALVASGRIVSPLTRVKVKFLKWVYLGDEAIVRLPNTEQIDPKLLKVEVLDLPVLSAELLYGKPKYSKTGNVLTPSPRFPLVNSLNLSFSDLDNLSGDAFTPTAGDTALFFPRLTTAIGATAVAEIAACSYIVGMEAPGLHSMFSKLDITIHTSAEEQCPRAAIHYLVESHDERFRKARIAVTGSSIGGVLDVFIRVPPVKQASMETVASRVERSEFSNMRALVIGGSRGLGELTAKIVAAGGGIPTITFARGMADADSVAGQIREWGGQVEVLPYDVRIAPKPQLTGLGSPPTHLFYFATNAISRPTAVLVSSPILAEFATFYLQGFHDLCVQLTQRCTFNGVKLVVFYPSSVFITERPAGMTEYAMIKAAGEEMCRDMNQYLPGLHIVTTRLPRLRTDQTAGIMPEHETDAIDTLLPLIRRMNVLGRVHTTSNLC